jgi:hypothetical protein
MIFAYQMVFHEFSVLKPIPLTVVSPVRVGIFQASAPNGSEYRDYLLQSILFSPTLINSDGISGQ